MPLTTLNPIRSLAIALDPSMLMEELGFAPDPWQRRALRSQSQRLQLLCSRQSGKSTVTACIALHTACYQSDSLVLLVSRSERQSGELFLKVSEAYKATRPVEAVRELAFSLELENGSRILALPGDAANLRCYSGVRLVVVDEAALRPRSPVHRRSAHVGRVAWAPHYAEHALRPPRILLRAMGDG